MSAAQLTDLADNFILGMLTDGAGIEDYDVGLVRLIAKPIAQTFKLTFDELRVQLVHLATHGFDIYSLVHTVIIIGFKVQNQRSKSKMQNDRLEKQEIE